MPKAITYELGDLVLTTKALKAVRAPSIKALTTCLKDVDVSKARLIREAIKIEGKEGLIVFAEAHCPKCVEHFRRCYNMPSRGDIRAAILDELLDTCGVEYLFKTSEGLSSWCSLPSDELILTYCNAGDTYATTLIRYRGRWQIGCYGDVAERYL
jgi:hypothetical protein